MGQAWHNNTRETTKKALKLVLSLFSNEVAVGVRVLAIRIRITILQGTLRWLPGESNLFAYCAIAHHTSAAAASARTPANQGFMTLASNAANPMVAAAKRERTMTINRFNIMLPLPYVGG